MISSAILAALVAVLIAAFNLLVYRNPLYPGLVQAVVWAATLATFVLHQENFISVPDHVFFLILAGVIAFSFGTALGDAIGRWAPRRHLQIAFDHNGPFFLVGLLIIVLTFSALHTLLGIAIGLSGARDILTNLRLVLTNEATSPWLGLFNLTAYPSLLVHVALAFTWAAYFEARRPSIRNAALVLLGISLVNAVMST